MPGEIERIDWRSVRAVGIDVMDTVLYDPFREAIERATGLDLARLSVLRNRESYHAFELGQLSEREYGKRFFRPEAAMQLDAEVLWRELARDFVFLPGMERLLERISTRLPVHTMTNYSRWYERLRRRFALDRFITCHHPSYIVGFRKPDPHYYEKVLERTGLAAKQLLFVDDRQRNVEGAYAAGMPSILFESADRLESDIAPLLA
jgi:HAD superfamily hydrolase (TIGR01509 family)